MPVNWNAENEARLLLVIIEVCEVKVTKEQWTTIAEKMGKEFTMEGVRQHVQKSLRVKAAGGSPKKAAPADKTKPKSGGRKKKGDDGEKAPSASPRKRRIKKDTEDNSDDDDKEPESPTKKMKHEETEDGGIGSFFDQEDGA